MLVGKHLYFERYMEMRIMGIYEELGVERYINAMGTYTAWGGSKMSEQTLSDMRDAASSFCDIKDLQIKVGRKIAEMTNNEAAYVCNGAACGVYLALLSALSLKLGKKTKYLTREDFASAEVIVYRSHLSPYDVVFSQLGVKTVELGNSNHVPAEPIEDIRNAITDKTFAAYFLNSGWTSIGAPTLEQMSEAVKPYGIPVIMDAAAMLPPVENLWGFTSAGADVAVFSGGKDIHGPQSSGLIVGSKKIIDNIIDFGFPTPGLGRMMKTGREEIVGLYSALKQFMAEDPGARLQDAEEQVLLAKELLEGSGLFTAERSYPNEAGQPIPRVGIRLKDANITVAEILAFLREGEVHIIAQGDKQQRELFYLNPMTMTKEEMRLSCEKLIKFM